MPDETTPRDIPAAEPVHRQPATAEECRVDYTLGADARTGFDANVQRQGEQS